MTLRFAILCLLAFLTTGSEAYDRTELEEVARRHYSPEEIARGQSYRTFGYVLYFIQTGLAVTIAWFLARTPLEAWRRRAVRVAGGRAWVARGLLLTAVFLALEPLRLFFSALRFAHAKTYGLRHDGWPSFALDWIKGQAIAWALLVIVGLVVLGLFGRWRRTSWAIGALAVSVLTVLYVALSPLVIDPLFNTFTRLADPPLEQRLLDLARVGGVPADEVWVADASRRTKAVNAYFTGEGETRRIVLYDTLLEFDEDEIVAVVAHEVGHWRGHHVRWGLAMGLAAAALGLFAAHRVLGRWADAGWRGLSGRADPALALPAYALYVTLMTAAAVPSNWVSRRMETAADLAAIELTGDPDAIVRTEVRLGRRNLADVLPPSWIEFTLYTHPANARRILMAERAK